MLAADTRRQIDAVFRIEAPRLIAGLARMTRDVGLAENWRRTRWSRRWSAGRRRHAGQARRLADGDRQAAGNRPLPPRQDGAEKHQEIGRDLEWEQERAAGDIEAALDDTVGDDLLASSSPPAIRCFHRCAGGADAALLGGLTTDEIARAYLAAEPRLPAHRARQTHAVGIGRRFETPHGAELHARLRRCWSGHLIFNEGYARPPDRTGCGAALL